MSFIVPRNWEKFQHADATKRGRDPVWIKNYTRLLSDDDYLDLTPGQRGVLHGLWLEYARSGRELRCDTVTLTRRLGLRVTQKQLDSLVSAGFIELREHRENTASAPREHRESTAAITPETPEEQTAPAETLGESEFCQDIVVTVSSLEEKREEKKELGAFPSSQNLLAEFIDGMRLGGVELPNRVVGQTAKAVKALLDEGLSPEAVRAGLSRMAERRIVQPSLLPNFVAEAGLPRPEVGRYGRGMTTQQILDSRSA